MWIRPDTTYPRCAAWQLSVPTTGLMHSDHRHPGCAVSRATAADPRCTTLNNVLSGVRVSSGRSTLLDSMLVIPVSFQDRVSNGPPPHKPDQDRPPYTKGWLG